MTLSLGHMRYRDKIRHRNESLVYGAIEGHWQVHGVPPTYREIATATKLCNEAVYDALRRLEEGGMIAEDGYNTLDNGNKRRITRSLRPMVDYGGADDPLDRQL